MHTLLNIKPTYIKVEQQPFEIAYGNGLLRRNDVTDILTNQSSNH